MKTSKLLLAGLAGGVTNFLLGYLTYMVLLAGYMAKQPADCQRAEDAMIFWAGGLSCLILGLFLAYVFGRWASIKTLMGGLVGGAIIGAFVAGSSSFSSYAWTTYLGDDLSRVIVEIVVVTVMTAITGAVVGWVLGMGKE